MKTILRRCVLTSVLAAALLTSAAAARRQVTVQLDGAVLDAPCYVENGVTYVPLRALLNRLGGWSVSWDSATRTAVAVSDEERLVADPDADTVTLGGVERSGRVTVESGVTYVPLRLTMEALGARVVWDARMGGAAVTTAGAAYDAEDLYWLSRIINAEAGAESIRGQIAVGNVVLNRVRSDDFPDSISDVIFDCKDAVQFEPLSNGTLYETPSDEAVESAKAALDGADAAGDALYFYAPALSQGLWINANCSYLKTIGCHRFYA